MMQERRRGADRRLQPTRPFSWKSLRGSRRRIRRASDLERHYYVDRYGPATSLCLTGTALLCAVDAALTHLIVEAGGVELNPLMAFLLSWGWGPFLSTKYGLTVLSLLVILLHKNYRPFRTSLPLKYLLPFLCALYLGVVGWEIYLLSRLGL